MSELTSAPVIVCGMGNVGFRLVQLLRRLGEDVVVVTREAREDWRRIAEAAGARIRLGDARDEAILVEAGIVQAKALVIATAHDPSNIEIALDAKRIRADIPLVMRLFDQHLARCLESAFGIRRVASVSALAAPAFTAAALGERWLGSFDLDGEEFVVGRVSPSVATHRLAEQRLAILQMQADSEPLVVGRKDDWKRLSGIDSAGPARRRRFSGMSLIRDARSAPAGIRRVWCNAPTPIRSAIVSLLALFTLSVGVFRVALDLSLVDAIYYIVSTVTTVGYGDITPKAAGWAIKLYASMLMIMGSAGTAVLYSMLTEFLVTARFRQMLGRETVPEQGHVVVAGLGNVGFRVADALVRAGDLVVAIERDSDAEFAESIRSRASLVIGDARSALTLGRAGASGARAVVSVIDDDAVNLAVVLAARQINPQARLVARIFDADFADKIQMSLGVNTALSTSLVAAPTFAAAALYPGVLVASVVDNQLVVVLRTPGPADKDGLDASELAAARTTRVLFRRSRGQAWQFSDDGRALDSGDEMVVAVVRSLAGTVA